MSYYMLSHLRNHQQFGLFQVTKLIVPLGCYKKGALLQFFWEYFHFVSFFAWNFANLLKIRIHIYLPIFCRLIFRRIALIFFTSTRRLQLHSVTFWVPVGPVCTPRKWKCNYQLFGNDVIFSPSRVLVSDNCKQSITDFCCAMLASSTALAVMRCLSVCHVRTFCQNE